MSVKQRSSQDLIDELRAGPLALHVDELRAGPLALHVDAFEQLFHDGRYAASTLRQYLGCLAHLAHWMSQQQRSVEARLQEPAIAPTRYQPPDELMRFLLGL
jgi:hypothetical protein